MKYCDFTIKGSQFYKLYPMSSSQKLPASIQEAQSIIHHFYGFDREGDPDRYTLGDAFKDDAYRMIVFHFHLSIEELLKAHLHRHLGTRAFTKKQNIEFIQKLSFRQTIEWSTRLGVITKKAYAALKELNDIRNSCAHNWVLNSYRMTGVSKKQRKRIYKIRFNGKNLLTPKVMKDDFMPQYGDLYLALWRSYYL